MQQHRKESEPATVKYRLWATNTGFAVPDTARATHISNLPSPTTQESQIDFVFCPLTWKRRCSSASSRRECPLYSDHFPVLASLFTSLYTYSNQADAGPPKQTDRKRVPSSGAEVRLREGGISFVRSKIPQRKPVQVRAAAYNSGSPSTRYASYL